MSARRATIARLLVGGAAAAAALVATPGPAVAEGSPTCGGVVGTVHGHHVVSDYVDGEGHDSMTWPPAGQVDAAGGAAHPGAPGAHGHMLAGIAPGASFCTASNSPGWHVGD